MEKNKEKYVYLYIVVLISYSLCGYVYHNTERLLTKGFS